MFDLSTYFQDENFKAKALDEIIIPTLEDFEDVDAKDAEMFAIRCQLMHKANSALEEYMAIEEKKEEHLETLRFKLMNSGFDQVDLLTEEKVPAVAANVEIEMKGMFSSISEKIAKVGRKLFDKYGAMQDAINDLKDAIKEKRDAQLGEDKDVSVDFDIGVDGKVNAGSCGLILKGITQYFSKRDGNLTNALNASMKNNSRSLEEFAKSGAPYGLTKSADGGVKTYVAFAKGANKFAVSEVKSSDTLKEESVKIVTAGGDLDASVMSMKEMLTVLDQASMAAKTIKDNATKIKSFNDTANGYFEKDEKNILANFINLFYIDTRLNTMANSSLSETLSYVKKCISKYK